MEQFYLNCYKTNDNSKRKNKAIFKRAAIKESFKNMETISKRCAATKNSINLPKELLSTVTLTTHHLLPTTKETISTTHRSHLKDPPDYYCAALALNTKNTTSNSSSSSYSSHNNDSNNYCHNDENLSYACTSSLSFYKYSKNKNRMLQQQNSTAITNSFSNTTTTTNSMNTATIFPTSSPAFKVIHHRKNECNRSKCNNSSRSGNNYTKNNNINTLTTLANALRQFLQSYTYTSTIKTAAAAAKPSKTKAIAATIRCKAATATTRAISTPALATKRTILTRTRFRLPSLSATSFFTLLTLVCLETVLLSTVSNCAKTFYMHWNTSNSIFRIDNTDHIIDVNKGNLAFEFDQVHIICPVYEPGTFENETEKYIIYNVSKVEYETCRITNADPRVIAICDKPQKLMFFTITFRPFTPQPGGLEFLPGNDYYFISTSSKDDLYRRIGGRCSTNNMKVVFKVCCAPEEKNKTTTTSIMSTGSGHGGPGTTGGDGVVSGGGAVNGENVNIDMNAQPNANQHHINNINTIGINSVNTGLMPVGGGGGGGSGNIGVQLHPMNSGSSGTSINTNIDQFNRIPMQTNGINVIGNNIGGGVGIGSHGVSGIMLTPGHGGINMIPTGVGVGGGVIQYPGHHHPGQTGVRINNVPSQQHYPSHKNNNNNNNGKDAGGEVGGGVLEIGFGDQNQFLPPIINTNHSNIVQSTIINWPTGTGTGWGTNQLNTNIHINRHINVSSKNANKNNYYSPSHRPTNKNTNKHDNFDKHPNEVVKNEELSYISGATSTLHQRWSWKTITVANFKSIITAATTSALAATGSDDSISSSCSSKISRIFKHIVNKMHYYDELGLNLNLQILDIKHIISNFKFNPIILLPILLISLTHYTLKYTISSSMLLSLSYSSSKSSQNCHVFESESTQSSSYQPVKHRKTNEILLDVEKNFR